MGGELRAGRPGFSGDPGKMVEEELVGVKTFWFGGKTLGCGGDKSESVFFPPHS